MRRECRVEVFGNLTGAAVEIFPQKKKQKNLAAAAAAVNFRMVHFFLVISSHLTIFPEHTHLKYCYYKLTRCDGSLLLPES